MQFQTIISRKGDYREDAKDAKLREGKLTRVCDTFCEPSSSPPLVLRGRARVGVSWANRRSTPTPTLPLSTRGGGNAPQKVSRTQLAFLVVFFVTILQSIFYIRGFAKIAQLLSASRFIFSEKPDKTIRTRGAMSWHN